MEKFKPGDKVRARPGSWAAGQTGTGVVHIVEGYRVSIFLNTRPVVRIFINKDWLKETGYSTKNGSRFWNPAEHESTSEWWNVYEDDLMLVKPCPFGA